MQISRMSQHNFNSLPAKNNSQQNSVNFTGALPHSKFFEPVKTVFKPVSFVNNKLSDAIAKGYASVIKTEKFKKLVEVTDVKNLNVVKHLSALVGLMVSGVYIKRTLSNDKLAPEQKSTLAINQGIVSVVATTLGYTVNGMADKKIGNFVRKYAAANYKDPQLKSLKMGVGAAASMVIFSTMYRYVSPVLVTPIANAIGNVLQANKKAAAAAAAAKPPVVAQATPAAVKSAEKCDDKCKDEHKEAHKEDHKD